MRRDQLVLYPQLDREHQASRIVCGKRIGAALDQKTLGSLATNHTPDARAGLVQAYLEGQGVDAGEANQLVGGCQPGEAATDNRDAKQFWGRSAQISSLPPF